MNLNKLFEKRVKETERECEKYWSSCWTHSLSSLKKDAVESILWYLWGENTQINYTLTNINEVTI